MTPPRVDHVWDFPAYTHAHVGVDDDNLRCIEVFTRCDDDLDLAARLTYVTLSFPNQKVRVHKGGWGRLVE